MRSFRKLKYLIIVLAPVLFVAPTTSLAASFQFEAIVSLDDMRAYLQNAFPLGTPQGEVRTRLVTEGKARMHGHPTRPNIEKYVYDINLCSLYVWRWNVSANFDDQGKLAQLYLNGEPLYASGEPPRNYKTAAKPGAKQQIIKAKRPRPEASKGENALAYVELDLDAGSKDVDDEFILGGGPSRADPKDLGKLHGYKSVERWRSIFDDEPAHAVVAYAGACN